MSLLLVTKTTTMRTVVGYLASTEVVRRELAEMARVLDRQRLRHRRKGKVGADVEKRRKGKNATDAQTGG